MKLLHIIAVSVIVSLIVSLSAALADSISRTRQWHDFAMKMVEQNVSLALEVRELRAINGIVNYANTNRTEYCHGRSAR